MSEFEPEPEPEPELDIDGPAAPPRANGEMVFEHPWQRRLFATTMALCQSEAIRYEQFREGLIAEISEHPDHYWSSWQDALERLLEQQQICDLDQLAQRAREFGQHPPTSSPLLANCGVEGPAIGSCIVVLPTRRISSMAIPAKPTPLQQTEARRLAAASDKPKRMISDEEKATRKDRVAKAKDALARSVGTKGDHVAPARAAIKTYLQRLNEPKQPDDAQFETLIEAPFKAPYKKKTNDRRF